MEPSVSKKGTSFRVVRPNLTGHPTPFSPHLTHTPLTQPQPILPLPPCITLPCSLPVDNDVSLLQRRGTNGRLQETCYSLYSSHGLGMAAEPWDDLPTAQVAGEIQRAAKFWEIYTGAKQCSKFIRTVATTINNLSFNPEELCKLLYANTVIQPLNLACLLWGSQSNFRNNLGEQPRTPWDTINTLIFDRALLTTIVNNPLSHTHLLPPTHTSCTRETFLYNPAVYIFVFPAQQKVYIGSSTCLVRRIGQHFSNFRRLCSLKKSDKHATLGCTLYTYMHKCKEGNYLMFPIEMFPSHVNYYYLHMRETFWILKFRQLAMNVATPLMGCLFTHVNTHTINALNNPLVLFSWDVLAEVTTENSFSKLKNMCVLLLSNDSWQPPCVEWLLSFLLILQHKKAKGYRYFYNIIRKIKQRTLKELKLNYNLFLPLTLNIRTTLKWIPPSINLAEPYPVPPPLQNLINLYLHAITKTLPPKYRKVGSACNQMLYATTGIPKCSCENFPQSWKPFGHLCISHLNLRKCEHLPPFLEKILSSSTKDRVGRFQHTATGIGITEPLRLNIIRKLKNGEPAQGIPPINYGLFQEFLRWRDEHAVQVTVLDKHSCNLELSCSVWRSEQTLRSFGEDNFFTLTKNPPTVDTMFQECTKLVRTCKYGFAKATVLKTSPFYTPAQAYTLLKPKCMDTPHPKFRLVLSHFNKNGKGLRKLVGKALSFTVKHIQALFCNGVYCDNTTLPPSALNPVLARLQNDFTLWAQPTTIPKFSENTNRVRVFPTWGMDGLPQFFDSLTGVHTVTEYDIVKMFYNIPKEGLMYSLVWFFNLLFLSTCKKKVSVSKTGRCSWGNTVKHNSITLTIQTLFYFQIYSAFEDIFAVFRCSTFSQTKGVQIGSSVAAQLAEIYCLWRENSHTTTTKVCKLLRETLDTAPPWVTRQLHLYRVLDAPVRKAMPSMMKAIANTPKLRYRDNILFFHVGEVIVVDTLKWLQQVYGVPITLESSGQNIESLGLQLSASKEGLKYGIRKKCRTVQRFRTCTNKIDTQVTLGGLKGAAWRMSFFTNSLNLWIKSMIDLMTEALSLRLSPKHMGSLLLFAFHQLLLKQHTS